MVLGGGAGPEAASGRRFFADLHTHSNASFDSLASPSALVRTAAQRGLTHLAITDHDRIEGALAGRDIAREVAPELTVIVGEEIRTAEGDVIALFLESAIAPGLPAAETIAAVRDQGGLVGIPHPFDRFRGSLLRDAGLEQLVDEVDWIETHNARVAVGNGNVRAAELAHATGRPGIGVSDAHTAFEVGVAYTAFDRDPSTPTGLLAALGTGEVVGGRASLYARLVTPVAKVIQRSRGNRRVAIDGARERTGDVPR
ncbi:MAG TPA: PHP domain-containing protein [Candidatus Limnocylindrales bacterium]|nr:PHP domain-containing protein [Candidatus Limnocylindrales bacterium]